MHEGRVGKISNRRLYANTQKEQAPPLPGTDYLRLVSSLMRAALSLSLASMAA